MSEVQLIWDIDRDTFGKIIWGEVYYDPNSDKYLEIYSKKYDKDPELYKLVTEIAFALWYTLDTRPNIEIDNGPRLIPIETQVLNDWECGILSWEPNWSYRIRPFDFIGREEFKENFKKRWVLNKK